MPSIDGETAANTNKLERRDFEKSLLALLALFGGATATLYWREKFPLGPAQELMFIHEESGYMQALLQATKLPNFWPENVRRVDLINRNYVQPDHLLETAINNADSPFYDANSPFVVPDSIALDFVELLEKNASETFRNTWGREDLAMGSEMSTALSAALIESGLMNKIEQLWNIFANVEIANIRDVVNIVNNPVLNGSCRMMKELCGTLSGEEQQLIAGMTTSYEYTPELTETDPQTLLRKKFASEYKRGMDTIQLEFKEFIEKYKNKSDGKIRIDQLITFFINRNQGNELAGLIEAQYFTRSLIRCRYDENEGKILREEEPIKDSAESRFLGEAVRDQLSLILPWDKLLKFPDQIPAAASQVESADDQMDWETMADVQDWYFTNRIGALPHYLSLVIMSACLPPQLIRPIILMKHYGFPKNIMDSGEFRWNGEIPDTPNPNMLLIGFDGYGAEFVFENMRMMPEYGRIKTATDMLTTARAAELRKLLHRAGGNWLSAAANLLNKLG